MFTQNFHTDFDAVTAGLREGYRGPPYAMVRFGDGEAAIISGRFYQTADDGWNWPPGGRVGSDLAVRLRESLECELDGWTVGVPCPRHEPRHFIECLPLVKVPIERITFAKVLVDGNYRRWRALQAELLGIEGPAGGAESYLPRQAFVVASSFRGKCKADFEVPADWMMRYSTWEADAIAGRLVDRLLDVRTPILLSCGPLANVVALAYWKATEGRPTGERQVIIDVGSAIDDWVKGRRARQYDPQAQHVWPEAG